MITMSAMLLVLGTSMLGAPGVRADLASADHAPPSAHCCAAPEFTFAPAGWRDRSAFENASLKLSAGATPDSAELIRAATGARGGTSRAAPRWSSRLGSLGAALIVGTLFSTPALLKRGAEISGYQHATYTWWGVTAAAAESGANDFNTLDRVLMMGLPAALAIGDFIAAGRHPEPGAVFGVNAAVLTVAMYQGMRKSEEATRPRKREAPNTRAR